MGRVAAPIDYRAPVHYRFWRPFDQPSTLATSASPPKSEDRARTFRHRTVDRVDRRQAGRPGRFLAVEDATYRHQKTLLIVDASSRFQRDHDHVADLGIAAEATLRVVLHQQELLQAARLIRR